MHSHLVETTWNSLLTAFGEEVKVISKQESDFHVVAIFRKTSLEVGPDFSKSLVRTQQPHLKYRPRKHHISVGDKLLIRNQLYRAEEAIPDGYGGVVLELQEISEAGKCS